MRGRIQEITERIAYSIYGKANIPCLPKTELCVTYACHTKPPCCCEFGCCETLIVTNLFRLAARSNKISLQLVQ